MDRKLFIVSLASSIQEDVRLTIPISLTMISFPLYRQCRHTLPGSAQKEERTIRPRP